MADEAINRDRRTSEGHPAPGGGRPGPPSAFNPAEAALNPFKWLILIGLITASIMEVLDTTIINVALPQMMGNLSATRDEIGWVATGYILSNVIVLPMTAWLSQRFGRKRYLVFSIGLFLVASFFCGTSRSLVELVFWRIIQGAGGAALLSTAQATLRQIFPPEQQGMVQALFVLGIIVAPTLGPTLGGIITDNYNWPWVFFVNIPIGLIAMTLVTVFLHDAPGARKAGQIDWAGIALLTIGLGSLQYVLEEGQRNDWFQDPMIARLAVIAGISLIALVAWQLSPKNKAPVIDFRVLQNKQLIAGLMLFLALGFGLYGGVFIFPMFSQNILHFTPTVTGLVLLPGGIATGVGAIFCGRVLSGKKQLIDSRALILFGMGIFILSMWQLGHLTTLSGEPDTRLGLIIRGLGLGFLFTPINITVFASLRGPDIPQASGLINLTRQLGGSFGIAVLNTYIADQTAYHRTNLAAHLDSANAAFTSQQSGLAHQFMAHGSGLETAKNMALSVMNGRLEAQAMTMSYNDAFLLLMVSFIVTAPAVFLLKKPKAATAAAGGH